MQSFLNYFCSLVQILGFTFGGHDLPPCPQPQPWTGGAAPARPCVFTQCVLCNVQ